MGKPRLARLGPGGQQTGQYQLDNGAGRHGKTALGRQVILSRMADLTASSSASTVSIGAVLCLMAVSGSLRP